MVQPDNAMWNQPPAHHCRSPPHTHQPGGPLTSSLDTCSSTCHAPASKIPVPATSDSINANPHLYLPWMWEMLQDIEFLAAAHEPGSKLFSMVPQCGNQTRFITITSTCLHRYAFLCALATKPSAFYRRITDAHHVGTVSTTCQVFYMSSVLDITCNICRLCLMSSILLPHLPCGRS